MKEPRRERSPLYRKILFGFTDHPITVWAGVILLRVYFEWIKLREELEETLVECRKRSNNQIGSVEVMLSWFYGLALGAERFEHFTRYRREGLWGELLGMKRFCSPDTLRRLFLRFHYREVTETSEWLMRFSLARMRPILMGLVIHRIPSTAWRVVARGIEVADLEVSLPNWKAAKRRFVCLRQEVSERPEARGRRLIDCPGYTYRVRVTSAPDAAEGGSLMYAGSA